MLKHFRKVIAFIVITIFFLVFLEIPDFPVDVGGKLASIQLLPVLTKIFSGHRGIGIAILASIILITFIFGRIYCSVICPLGILQDMVIFIRKILFRKRKFSFRNVPAKIRYVIAGVSLIAFFVGFNLFVVLFGPYSNFGRITSNFFKPVFAVICDVAGDFFRSHDIYIIPVIKVHPLSTAMVVVAAVIFLFIAIASLLRGRWFCNYLCPVGALLGLVARKSLFRVNIDNEKCYSCGKCESLCKAGCIDSAGKRVDTERCIACFNCVGSCPGSHIKYGVSKTASAKDSNNEKGRRGFLKETMLFVIGLGVFFISTTKLLAGKVKGIAIRKRNPFIIPPGAKSLEHYKKSCIACNLCVSACPTSVLSSNFSGAGNVDGIMKPVMDYSSSYCLYDCVECANICPAGALEDITPAEKKLTQLGTANLIKENCIAWMEHKYCTICDEYCPTKAVHAITHPDAGIPGLTVPEVDPERCIGCGACEHVCPAKPVKAIYVDGNAEHTRAKPPVSFTGDKKSVSKKQQGSSEALEEFPF